jgi:Fe-S-cluster-containing hydrogenase component 2
MSACPVNAIAIDESTGAKLVIDSLCIGCHLCTIACPFGTVFTLPQSDKAAKCNLCGGDPACATACPTAAIEYVELDKAGEWFDPWAERVHSNYVEANR